MNYKTIEASEELIEILEEIRAGYKEALGFEISWRQSTSILASKLKKAKITFNFP